MDKIEKERASHTHTQTHLIKKKQRTFGLNIRNKSKYSKETISIQSLRKKIFVLDHRLKIGIQRKRDVYINNETNTQSNGKID